MERKRTKINGEEESPIKLPLMVFPSMTWLYMELNHRWLQSDQPYKKNTRASKNPITSRIHVLASIKEHKRVDLLNLIDRGVAVHGAQSPLVTIRSTLQEEHKSFKESDHFKNP
ncbi:hypothetical protein YC2023_073793 [Brassica napus]